MKENMIYCVLTSAYHHIWPNRIAGGHNSEIVVNDISNRSGYRVCFHSRGAFCSLQGDTSCVKCKEVNPELILSPKSLTGEFCRAVIKDGSYFGGRGTSWFPNAPGAFRNLRQAAFPVRWCWGSYVCNLLTELDYDKSFSASNHDTYIWFEIVSGHAAWSSDRHVKKTMIVLMFGCVCMIFNILTTTLIRKCSISGQLYQWITWSSNFAML